MNPFASSADNAFANPVAAEMQPMPAQHIFDMQGALF